MEEGWPDDCSSEAIITALSDEYPIIMNNPERFIIHRLFIRLLLLYRVAQLHSGT